MTALTPIYEPVMNALLALLTDALVPGVVRYTSRKFITWEALIQSIQSGSVPFVQPAMLLYDGVGFGGGKTVFEQRNRGTPPVRIMYRTIIVYAQVLGGNLSSGPDPDVVGGGSIFATISEAIEGALLPASGDPAVTLGGLVSHCWIEGESHWLVGDIDPGGQGMMTIPVRIMIP